MLQLTPLNTTSFSEQHTPIPRDSNLGVLYIPHLANVPKLPAKIPVVREKVKKFGPRCHSLPFSFQRSSTALASEIASLDLLVHPLDRRGGSVSKRKREGEGRVRIVGADDGNPRDGAADSVAEQPEVELSRLKIQKQSFSQGK